jgi:hypothetical protein
MVKLGDIEIGEPLPKFVGLLGEVRLIFHPNGNTLAGRGDSLDIHFGGDITGRSKSLRLNSRLMKVKISLLIRA